MRDSLMHTLRRDLPGGAVAPDPGPFPGRWPTVVSLVVAPLLLLAGELAKAPHHFYFPDQIAAYSGAPGQMAWGYGLWFAGQLLLVPAFAGLANAIARTRPVLGAATGIVCLLGLMVGAFFEGANFVALQLSAAHSPELATAFVEYLYPRAGVVYALVWAPNLGWVLLAAGLFSTHSVGAARFLFLLLMALHANGILKGFSVAGTVLDVLLCVAFATLAAQILRYRWSPRTLPGRDERLGTVEEGSEAEGVRGARPGRTDLAWAGPATRTHLGVRTMLILLPPSEGKATSGEGPRLDLAGLTLPELTGARERVMAALAELCSGPEDTAMDVLGLSATQTDALKRNLDLATAPTLRAADLYTGVLYDRLGLPGLLGSGAAGRVRERVLVFSGLWGVAGPADRLPPYRLSMGVKLPPLGGLGAFWKRAAAAPLGGLAEGRLLVDCRSAAYAAAFRPTGATAERTVAVRVLREREVDGVVRRSVVSHMAKATRGDIARALLVEDVDAATPEELVGALRDLGHTVELPPATKPGTARVMDVVVRD